MNSKLAIRLAGACGFTGVALGAVGAHALKAQLAAFGTSHYWETAVLYHLVHAVALLVLATQSEVKAWRCWIFVAGIVIFSGSLYALALTNARWLGAVTPVGGVCFLIGWGCLLIRGRV